ncbi:uncharacterized protein LOC108454959 [Gossypium arboreum]|uniref:uncharacterized protein LOC108454959 n=1 Tax=Gossypium arboreum TaxID=29729 RepID=UPI0008194CD0|nr:uncharacterized protein LOC108454959 [Gossypium arboreum]
MGKSQSSAPKKSKKYHDHSTTFMGYSSKERGSQRSNLGTSSPSVTNVGSVGNPKPKCKYYNKFHFGECRLRSGACYQCGSFDHFLKDCPERIEKDIEQTSKPSNPASRGRPPRHPGNVSRSRGTIKDTTVKSEVRAQARTYAIRVREYTSVPDVITGVFSLLYTDITSLIDLGYCFSADLLLLPFDEFDVILGIDWLTQHDTVKYVRKGYDVYLAYVLDTKVSESNIQSVPVVYEFSGVFPRELLSLPPVSKVEFSIDLVLGTTPISIAPQLNEVAKKNKYSLP